MEKEKSTLHELLGYKFKHAVAAQVNPGQMPHV